VSQPALFDEDTLVRARARIDGEATSAEGAVNVSNRAPSQRMALLEAFLAHPEGLTDEEAATEAGLLKACYWKRCGELRRLGYITHTDRHRRGAAGVSRRVSTINEENK
jgi:hypothetical protein